jgi:hypothetical protein
MPIKAEMENKIMKNTINNTQKANEIKVNGNCKGVRDITNDIHYDSVKDAAKANGVANSTMSVAINRGYVCNGNQFVFEKDLHKSGDKLCAENAKANARADKAEAKLSEMETEMAEFRQWKAEQEAKRKAEEERLERERKEEEKRQKLIAQKKEKIAQYEAEVERRKAKLAYMEQKLMCAEIELEALMDNGKEVL